MLIIPPGDDWASVELALQNLADRYAKTNNPVYAMYAIRHCFQRSVTPPDWALQYVAVSFHDYFIHGGEKPIEDCLQLNPGRGNDKLMKQFLLDERDDMIAWEMFRLVEQIGLSMANAAHMVKEKLEANDWNKTMADLVELSDDYIRDLYRKKYRKDLLALSKEESMSPWMTPEKRAALLATYPAHSLPPGFK